MGFAVPLGLLALASIAIPLLIHLRRKPARPILVGSLRHLAGSAPNLRAGARVSERLLLLLRVALLVLAATAIAEPFLTRHSTRPARRVTVAADSSHDIWSVLRDLDDTLPPGSSITLRLPDRVTVSGARPAIATEVQLQSEGTTVPPPFAGGQRRDVLIAATASRAAALRYLTLAFEAVASANGDTLGVRDLGSRPPRSLDGEWVIALGNSGESDSLAAAGAVVLRELPRGSTRGVRVGAQLPPLFVRRIGRGLVYELDGQFDQAGLIASGALPRLVAAIWPEDPATHATRITASQLQPVSRTEFIAPARDPIARPIAVAAIAVFIVERLTALGMLAKRREAA